MATSLLAMYSEPGEKEQQEALRAAQLKMHQVQD